ncbi:CHAT domain-containing protein [Nostoc sp. PA-18-2419]|uniref:CHAT domain-containing protein n=1 Tax=Nostoc sp. PA-18-2419 TaxID=2575443 RepID=UPI001109B13F|nr:CHAT domain-containing tetratricopeptide repeat protein [Nostoc sp. PA-18-2419]
MQASIKVKRLFGETHPDVTVSLNNLPALYDSQGRYLEAEQTHLTALAMIKELLGANHHLVAAMLNNLAVLYDAQFKYSQAESFLLEALAIVKSLFGDEHPQVATSMNNLATIYGIQQRYIEAEKLHLSVLKIRTSLFGKEHPDIPNSLNNLALIYLSLGRYEEAEQKYLEALSMRKHLLGDKHPDTALSLNNLATVLAAMERYSDALSYRIQASYINDLMINSIFAFSSESDRLSRTESTGFLGEIVAQKLLNARLYLGAEALETHLTTSKCPHIMLIATHGLFLPDSPPAPPIPNPINPKTEIPKLQLTNPMTRSALAFAGANTGLTGGSLPANAGKGVIFAQDIATLDLWANEITVLSACDTARGDIKIGEGVFGLRRAFTVAGAKTLVMSLWQVPDSATALLMERFFDNLLCGMGRVDALQSAQDYIRKITVKELRDSALGLEVLKELLQLKKLSADTEINCQEQDTPLEHPFYWGAWICQGNTDPLVT